MAKRVSKQSMKQTELQRIIMSMSGRYTAYEIFMDWIECSAIAVSNAVHMIHGKIWQEREAQYLSIMQKYSKEEQRRFPEMLGLLIEELEDNPRDVLGEAFMMSGMGADAAGQFFTPFHVSRLMSNLSVTLPNKEEKYSVNEPSCGSGGSIIAAALRLKELGCNYQKCMKVIAQDLDWRCVFMCYVQLSFLGIDAICVQGDTLMDPYRKGYPERRILRTPKHMGAIL